LSFWFYLLFLELLALFLSFCTSGEQHHRKFPTSTHWPHGWSAPEKFGLVLFFWTLGMIPPSIAVSLLRSWRQCRSHSYRLLDWMLTQTFRSHAFFSELRVLVFQHPYLFLALYLLAASLRASFGCLVDLIPIWSCLVGFSWIDALVARVNLRRDDGHVGYENDAAMLFPSFLRLI
jgi:hypothetical protein